MKIGIVGAGLIGGSVILALKGKGYDITVVTGNQKTREILKNTGITASDEMNSLKGCDVIFVCTPMNKTLDILDSLESIAEKNTIVADVASLKGFVMAKKRPFKLIGSHPMAGTEKSGFSAAMANLFCGAKWVLTPAADITDNDLQVINDIILKTGAKTLIMSPEEHDWAVAIISHMPMLISQALMKNTLNNDNALKLAASGFRDMTRLALSNTEMAEDMVTMNNANIKSALNDLSVAIDKLLSGDYKQEIENIKSFRSEMYNKDGCNTL